MGENMSDDAQPSIAELKRLQEEVAGGTWTRRGADALRDATPALLDIAAAALAHRKAKRVAAKTRHTLCQMAFPDTLSAESEAHDKEEIRCRDAYEAALAKVRE